MEENINIAKFLENAPKGLKLYSPICGECELRCVKEYLITVVDCEYGMHYFGIYGEKIRYGECLLFPSKEHRTWDNWQEVLFQVGDVISDETRVLLYTGKCGYPNSPEYALTTLIDNVEIEPTLFDYATPEEKEDFFKRLTDNGYGWDENTKEIVNIERQYTPKFSIGDWIVFNDYLSEITNIEDSRYEVYYLSTKYKVKIFINEIDAEARLATDKELIDAGIKEKLHKFKAGDVIRNKETGIVCKINYLAKNWYIFYKNKNQSGLKYENEDKWELVTVHKTKSERHYLTPHRKFFNWIFDRLVNVHGENPNVDYMLSLKERIDDLFPETEETDTTSEPTEEKPFTIDDFKPFDKVLVQDMRSHWTCDFYIRYDNLHKLYACISSTWDKCIPYNDETAHLLNTTNDCPEKYKTWED